MNHNAERIRDAMAGAIAGALLAIVFLLLSMLNATLHVIGGLFSGGASFEAMSGSTFTILIIVFMLAGAGIGFGLGYHATQDATITKNIHKWMEKHNHE